MLVHQGERALQVGVQLLEGLWVADVARRIHVCQGGLSQAKQVWGHAQQWWGGHVHMHACRAPC